MPTATLNEVVKFQSTPSVWRETAATATTLRQIPISIHSLRVEGDTKFSGAYIIPKISIHSLRVEGDYFVIVYLLHSKIISIHSLRVEGDSRLDCANLSQFLISIHSLRVEGDNRN